MQLDISQAAPSKHRISSTFTERTFNGSMKVFSTYNDEYLCVFECKDKRNVFKSAASNMVSDTMIKHGHFVKMKFAKQVASTLRQSARVRSVKPYKMEGNSSFKKIFNFFQFQFRQTYDDFSQYFQYRRVVVEI